MRQLFEILTRHRKPARRKVLETLARQGISAPARTRNLPLEECVRIVLEAVGEPVPVALPKLARKVKNLPAKA